MISNVLVIGDLHEPFCLDSYLRFNQNLYKKYNCTEVIFIGDILDSHTWSYHEHDPDGMSVGHELDAAINRLKRCYKTFPIANVLYGNHDLMISRKAKTAGLSSRFIKDFSDVIEAPKGWKFHHEYVKHNNLYLHGSIGNAIKRAKETRMSVIQAALYFVIVISIKDRHVYLITSRFLSSIN